MRNLCYIKNSLCEGNNKNNNNFYCVIGCERLDDLKNMYQREN